MAGVGSLVVLSYFTDRQHRLCQGRLHADPGVRDEHLNHRGKIKTAVSARSSFLLVSRSRFLHRYLWKQTNHKMPSL